MAAAAGGGPPPSYISRKNSRNSVHDPYSLRTLHYYDLVEHSCSAADAPGGRRLPPGARRGQQVSDASNKAGHISHLARNERAPK